MGPGYPLVQAPVLVMRLCRNRVSSLHRLIHNYTSKNSDHERVTSRIVTSCVGASFAGNIRVAVAMSGGIDSSVAAMLLKRHGFDVVGVYMRNWDVADELQAEDTSTDCESSAATRRSLCPADADLEDVKEVCHCLGITRLLEANFVKEYWNDVFTPFVEGFEAGIDTPNADVACNRFVKFAALRRFVARELGPSTLIATGHYARSAIVPTAERHGSTLGLDLNMRQQLEDDGDSARLLSIAVEARRRLLNADDQICSQYRAALFTATDATKDQTYFLGAIEESALRHYIFPVGHLTKAQVRALAAAASSPLKDCRVISKRESMGLCFIGKRSFDSFLGRYIPITPGRLVNIDDMQEIPVRAGGDGPHCPEHYRVLGKHAGMEILTLGQGAGVSGAKSRYFVCKKVCFRGVSQSENTLSNPNLTLDSRAEVLHNLLQSDGYIVPSSESQVAPRGTAGKEDVPSSDRKSCKIEATVVPPTLNPLSLQYGDVLVCSGSRHPALFCDYLVLRREDLHWIDRRCPAAHRREAPLRLLFKARYAQKMRACRLEYICAPDYSGFGVPDVFAVVDSYSDCTHVRVHFEQQPERAITPGQVCVLYRDISPGDYGSISAIAREHNISPAPVSVTAPAAGRPVECVGSARIHSAGPSYFETGREVPHGIKDI